MMPSPHVRVQARSNAARYGPRDMNFFGHACVAARIDSDPRVLLGAMLPDFASMSRTRLAGSEDPAVAAGIALHLATDDVFHGARGFLTLYSRGIDRLEA